MVEGRGRRRGTVKEKLFSQGLKYLAVFKEVLVFAILRKERGGHYGKGSKEGGGKENRRLSLSQKRKRWRGSSNINEEKIEERVAGRGSERFRPLYMSREAGILRETKRRKGNASTLKKGQKFSATEKDMVRRPKGGGRDIFFMPEKGRPSTFLQGGDW